MATVYRMPAYAHVSANTTKQLEFCVMTSDVLYEFMKNKGSYDVIINSSGHFTKEMVNAEILRVMGDSILDHNLEVYCGLRENDPVPTYPYFGDSLEFLGLVPNYIKPIVFDPVYPVFSQYTLVYNNVNIPDQAYGKIDGALTRYGSGNQLYIYDCYVDYTRKQVSTKAVIFPSDAFLATGGVNPKYLELENFSFPNVNITLTTDTNATEVTNIYVQSYGGKLASAVQSTMSGVKIAAPGTIVDDTDNPYGSHGTSGTGGGNGSYGDIDDIDPTDIPNLPSLSAANLGLVTLYNPTASVVQQLSSYLWSGMFDPASFKKLFADPMGCMIGLSIVPAIPASAGSKNIIFGNSDTGISSSYLSSNYCNVDCGSVSIDEYVGSFLDYEPFCKISLFLPYIGFITLSADDLVGGSINVQYNIDVLSGHCVAFVKHSVKGVLYSYSGNCITNVPITSQSFSAALQSYYSGLAGIAGAALGGLGSGAGGLVGLGAEIAKTAANTVFDMHPQFQRSGSMGGAAAIMGVQTPFIVIQRPRFSVPYHVQNYVGQMCNMTLNLVDCHGFTMVEFVHIDGVNATSEEIKEIEALLKEGVIL